MKRRVGNLGIVWWCDKGGDSMVESSSVGAERDDQIGALAGVFICSFASGRILGETFTQVACIEIRDIVLRLILSR